MPLMGGKEVADRLQAMRPGLAILFTSGYTDNAIVHHDILDGGVAFLQKPWSVSVLARKVREALNRPIEESE